MPLILVTGMAFYVWNCGKCIFYANTFLYLGLIIYCIVSSFVITGGQVSSIKELLYKELGMIFVCYFVSEYSSEQKLVIQLRNIGIFLSVLGDYEYFSKSSIFIKFVTVESRIIMQSSLGTSAARVRTIFIHPIICAVYTTFFWLCLLHAPFKEKWKNTLGGSIILVCLAGTQSRSSWISFCIVTSIYLLKQLKKNKIMVSKNIVILRFLFITLLGGIGYVFRVKISSNIGVLTARMISILDKKNLGSYNRITMIKMGINNWINLNYMNKLFGQGGGYALNLLRNNAINGWNVAVDNQYLTIFLNFGLIGVTLIFILIIRILVLLIRTNSKNIQLWCLTLISLFISCFFYEMFSWITVMLLFSISICMLDKSVRKIRSN